MAPRTATDLARYEQRKAARRCVAHGGQRDLFAPNP